MKLREFWLEWREYGPRVAIHNALWMWVHRDDDHVRTWNDEEGAS